MDWVIAYLLTGLFLNYVLEMGGDWIDAAMFSLLWLPVIALCLLAMLLDETA